MLVDCYDPGLLCGWMKMVSTFVLDEVMMYTIAGIEEDAEKKYKMVEMKKLW